MTPFLFINCSFFSIVQYKCIEDCDFLMNLKIVCLFLILYKALTKYYITSRQYIWERTFLIEQNKGQS